MANERLRDSIMRQGLTPADLAEDLGVDPKTVERWVTQGRAPYPRYRHKVAARLGESESWLWPDAVGAQRIDEASRSELVELYPRRASVPADMWLRLFTDASAFIDILVYAGLFLPEQMPTAIAMIRQKAASGVRVRLLLGDPESPAVSLRGEEEGIGDAVTIKTRNALNLLHRAFADEPAVQLRLHGTALYTSIYRGDDNMIANPHVLGLPAAQSPALHLRRLAAGGLFDTYATMVDRVWDGARPGWT